MALNQRKPMRAKAKHHSKQLPDLTEAERYALYERQDGRCPHCDQEMALDDADVHHRKKKTQGGTNHPDNLLLLPRVCHTDVHLAGTRSYELGHLVYRGDDPSAVRVRPISPHWSVAS